MRYIKTIDDITKDGRVDFGPGYEIVERTEEADAILMRSTDLHGYELPESIRAIGRCGAGVNNIPVEEYARRGVVVFNSPGANSNACLLYTSQYGSMPSASAACCCTEPNSRPELVPDPVTNAPTAPMTGAMSGNRAPVTAMQNEEMAPIMPA